MSEHFKKSKQNNLKKKYKAVICPYCQTQAKLVDSSIIYNKSYGWLYLCSNFPNCDAYVGCHQGTKKPLGTLANAELRQWRKNAHAAFDPLWKKKYEQLCHQANAENNRGKSYARKLAYQWLAKQLGIPFKQCHISWFDIKTCQKTVAICQPYNGIQGFKNTESNL